MKYFIIIIFVFFFSCNTNKNNSISSYHLKDELNYTVTFSNTPKTIISLAPSITEMIYALKIDNKLIGNTNYCNYPEAANHKPKVSDLITADYEKIISLKPDLILLSTEGNKKEMYDKLKSLGMTLFVTNPKDYIGILNSMQSISKIFKIETTFDSIKTSWANIDKKIAAKIVTVKEKKAYFFVTLNPIIAAGQNTFITDIMTKCKIKNLSAGLVGNYPQINREEIIKQNPDLILVADHSNITKKEILNQYPEWKTISNIEDKIILLNSDLFNRPGPRFLEAVKELIEYTK